MKIIKAILSCLCVVFNLATVSYAKEWRGIVPLHSTRADVERLLGAPTDPTSQCRCHYESGAESVFITYASGSPCGEGSQSLWKVLPDTVISISVSSKMERLFSDLKIDENRYEKTGRGDAAGVFYYSDAEEGITIEVNGDKVGSVIYSPAAKDDNLRCPTLTQDQSYNSISCSRIEIEGPKDFTKAGTLITFLAHITGPNPKLTPAYKWIVSSGVIVKGQGTPIITVNTTRLRKRTIIATVEVDGLEAGCPKSAQFKVKITNKNN